MVCVKAFEQQKYMSFESRAPMLNPCSLGGNDILQKGEDV